MSDFSIQRIGSPDQDSIIDKKKRYMNVAGTFQNALANLADVSLWFNKDVKGTSGTSPSNTVSAHSTAGI